jgi:hypothetical protein
MIRGFLLSPANLGLWVIKSPRNPIASGVFALVVFLEATYFSFCVLRRTGEQDSIIGPAAAQCVAIRRLWISPTASRTTCPAAAHDGSLERVAVKLDC